jgi:hypothetical protein
MENEKKEEKNNNKGIVILLSVLLIGSIGANFFLWSKKAQVEKEYVTKVDTLTIVKNNLEEDVKSKVAELQVFKGKNDSLDRVIEEGTTKITKLEGEVATLRHQAKGDASKKKQLDAKLAELNRLTEEYLERIDQLVTQNNILKKENEELTTNLSKANADKSDLTGKVNAASVLKTEYVKVTPLKKKFMSEKLEETSMAKKVIKFNSCFSVMDNKIAPAGKKTVYIRILAPDGKAVGSPNANSGKFKMPNGEDAQYTLRKEFDYAGAKVDLCMEYEEPVKNTFIAGKYSVEIYIDGALTSTTGVTLK